MFVRIVQIALKAPFFLAEIGAVVVDFSASL